MSKGVKKTMDMMTYAMAKSYTDTLKKSGGAGYTETTEKVLYKKAEVEFLPLDEALSSAQISNEQVNVAVDFGTLATVHFDGVDYECKVIGVNDEESLFGNLALLGEGDDTGEPFMGVFLKASDEAPASVVLFTSGTAESHIVGISVTTQIHHPIKEVYLPKTLSKTIDLDSYGIGDVILGLFASNGGQQQLANMEQFFADISTAQVPRLVMTGMGFRFVIDQCTRAFDGERAVQIAFAVTAVYNGSVFTLNVSVLSSGNGSALVYVTVT